MSSANSAAGIGTVPPARAALPKMKITRVRAYSPPTLNTLFNQSDMVVTVETDGGITGVGEGGAKDTLEQCAGRLIGQDPQYIEHLWQDMSRSFFYPPGREKEHALGALDLALWDIRGKALKQPVWLSLGEISRTQKAAFLHSLRLAKRGERVWADDGEDHVGSARLAYADEGIYRWLLQFVR